MIEMINNWLCTELRNHFKQAISDGIISIEESDILDAIMIVSKKIELNYMIMVNPLNVSLCPGHFVYDAIGTWSVADPDLLRHIIISKSLGAVWCK